MLRRVETGNTSRAPLTKTFLSFCLFFTSVLLSHTTQHHWRHRPQTKCPSTASLIPGPSLRDLRLLDFLKSSSVGLCAACTVLTTEKVWSELTDGCRAAPHTGADHRQQPRPQRGSGSQVGEAARWSTLHTAQVHTAHSTLLHTPHCILLHTAPCSIPPPADRWAQNATSAGSVNIQFFLP